MLLTGTQLLQIALRLRELARRAARPGRANAFTIDELRCAYKAVLGRDVEAEALEVVCDTLLEHDPSLKVASHFTRVHAFFDVRDVEALRHLLDGLGGLSRDAEAWSGFRALDPVRFVDVILNEDRDKEVGVFAGQFFVGPAYWGSYRLARALAGRLAKVGYKLRGRGRRGLGLPPLQGLEPFSEVFFDWGPRAGARTFGFYLEPRS